MIKIKPKRQCYINSSYDHRLGKQTPNMIRTYGRNNEISLDPTEYKDLKTKLEQLAKSTDKLSKGDKYYTNKLSGIPRFKMKNISDTWDLWKVCTEYLSELKEIILARDGKVVIRPDSGDPVDIICGNPNGATENERKGVVELLWDVFGGTETEKGYKLLDSHIGAIYGDSITRQRATEICQRLMDKGFASQVVFGIGSFTYQYNTRDTFGIAMKATYIEIGNEAREIFKKPITDDGTKISATGLLCVVKENNEYKLIDRVDWEKESQSELKTVFKDGKLIKEFSLAEIRTNAEC